MRGGIPSKQINDVAEPQPSSGSRAEWRCRSRLLPAPTEPERGKIGMALTAALRLFALLAVLSPICPGQEPAFAVVEKVSGHVGFYTADGNRIAGVKVGAYPHEAVLSPDRRSLYVTDNGVLWMTNPGDGGNTISIIDVQSRRKTGAIDLGKYRRPHGIDIDPTSGRLVVTVEGPDSLLLVDPTGRRVLRAYDVKGQKPHMVLLGPKAEWAYVSDSGSATLAAIRLETGDTRLIPCGKNPQGAILARDGRTIYLTESEADSISIIDATEMKRTGRIPTGKQPVRIAFSAGERMLVYALQAGEAVGFADPAARREIGQVNLSGKPLSLTVSADGNTAYSSVQDQDKIFVISIPDRKIVRVIPTPNGAAPDPVIPLK